jgi:non-ribosomal peptide synthetase component E (peptide arylation enzyme)
VLTRGNLAANQDQSLAGRFDVGPDDVVLLVLPLAHIYALNVGLGASITAGATMVLVDRFDPDAVLRTIAGPPRQRRARGPADVRRVARERSPRSRGVRLRPLAVSGAAPCRSRCSNASAR